MSIHPNSLRNFEFGRLRGVTSMAQANMRTVATHRLASPEAREVANNIETQLRLLAKLLELGPYNGEN